MEKPCEIDKKLVNSLDLENIRRPRQANDYDFGTGAIFDSGYEMRESFTF